MAEVRRGDGTVIQLSVDDGESMMSSCLSHPSWSNSVTIPRTSRTFLPKIVNKSPAQPLFLALPL